MLRKIIGGILLCCMLITGLASCSNTRSDFYEKAYTLSSGTLTLWVGRESEDGKKLSEEDTAKLLSESAALFEKYYTALTQGSDIQQLNSDVNFVFDCDEKTVSAVAEAIELCKKIAGRFVPINGAYTSLVMSGDTDEAKLLSALDLGGADMFSAEGTTLKKTKTEARLDLSCYAAGYALDKTAEFLAENKVKCARVSFGDVERVFGAKPDGTAYTVETVTGRSRGCFKITDGALASLSEEKGGISYGGDFTAVTVFATEGRVAQTLSGALMDMTQDEVKSLYKSGNIAFEAVLSLRDGTVMCTDRAEALYIEETTENEKNK